jgi:branched-subunit amino acid transport protein AzlD
MSDSITTVFIVVLCGAGTFLFRLLPMLRNTERPANPNVVRFTQAVGPAAIAALLAAMLMPFFETGASVQIHSRGIAAVASLLVTASMHRRFGGIAIPTVCGTICYGFLTLVI